MWQYNENEFVKLFGHKPKIIGEKIAGFYDYEQSDCYGFTLKMHLSVHEEYCILTLSHRDLNVRIFDLIFKKIEKIVCEANKLILQQTGNKKNIVVYFKPSYALTFEDRVS